MQAHPTKGVIARAIAALYLALILVCAPAVFASTPPYWTLLTYNATDAVNAMLLLPDGTVMCEQDGGNNWYLLSPDSSGHYFDGTWTTLSPMEFSRTFFSSCILPDGRVYVGGGEDGTGGSTAEVYDPKEDALDPWHEANPPSNPWTNTNFPLSLGSAGQQGDIIRDAESEVLPNGDVLECLVYPAANNGTALYDPSTGVWSAGPPSLQWLSEATVIKLPDGSLLTPDVSNYSNTSERYIPAKSFWITDGTLPVCIYDNSVPGFVPETGPGVLLPNGKAFFLSGTGSGTTGYSALYTPSGSTASGIWAAGAQIPGDFVARDAPCAMMNNGKVLCVVSPPPFAGGMGADPFPPPAAYFEYDYTNGPLGTFTPVNGPTGTVGANGYLQENNPSYYVLLLDLPDGTVLRSGKNSQLAVYTPAANTNSTVTALRPTISSITMNSNGSYHLVGTLLNGISEGASYGDDYQMATNFPIVSLTNGSGTVYYARTHDWSSTGVMETNQTVSTEFDLPPSLPSGSYSLTVIANGIPSTSYPFPVSIIWVDFSAGNSGNGTFANPYNTLAAGVSAVPAGGIIKIEGGGSSAETLPINKAMTIVAYNGAVTIGSNSGSPSTGAVVISGTQPAKITIEAAKTSAPVTRHRPQPGTPVKR